MQLRSSLEQLQLEMAETAREHARAEAESAKVVERLKRELRAEVEAKESAYRLQAVAEAEAVSARARATEAEAALHSVQTRSGELEMQMAGMRREVRLRRDSERDLESAASAIRKDAMSSEEMANDRVAKMRASLERESASSNIRVRHLEEKLQTLERAREDAERKADREADKVRGLARKRSTSPSKGRSSQHEKEEGHSSHHHREHRSSSATGKRDRERERRAASPATHHHRQHATSPPAGGLQHSRTRESSGKRDSPDWRGAWRDLNRTADGAVTDAFKRKFSWQHV